MAITLLAATQPDAPAQSLLWAAIGAACLGAVIGWLTIYSLRRIEVVTLQTLAGVVSVVAGGAVSKYLEFDARSLPFYPIGLALGFAIYILTLPMRMRLASPSEVIKKVEQTQEQVAHAREEVAKAGERAETNTDLIRALIDLLESRGPARPGAS